MKKACFLSVIVFSSWLSACGMQGDLYLPDEKTADDNNKEQKQSAADDAGDILLNRVYKA